MSTGFVPETGATPAPATHGFVSETTPPKPAKKPTRAEVLNTFGQAGVETPKNVRPNPLRQILPYIDVPLAAVEAGARDVTRGTPLEHAPDIVRIPAGILAGPASLLLHPRSNPSINQMAQDIAKGGPQAVSENDVLFRKGFLQRVLSDPNASAAQKAEARYYLGDPKTGKGGHPYVAGFMDLVQEFANPGNIVVGEGAGALGRVAARSNPAIADLLGAAQHVQRGLLSPITVPLGAAARLAGRTAASATLPIRAMFDRYTAAGMPERSPNFAAAGLRGHTAEQNAVARMHNRVNDATRDLTPAQVNEVGRLLHYDPKTGELRAPRNPAIPQPRKGPTLEERAASLRTMMRDFDVAQTERNLAEPGQTLRESGTYFPFGNYGKPVFKGDVFEKPGGEELGQDVEDTTPEAMAPPTRGGKFKSSTPKLGRSKGMQLSEPETFADLHPEFDLAYQLKQHYDPIARAIANEDFNRSLETLPSINPKTGEQRTRTIVGTGKVPLAARVPVQRYIRGPNGEVQVFGTGPESKTAMQKYIETQAGGKTRRAVRENPEMQAFAQERGISPGALGTRTVIQHNLTGPNARLRALRLAAKRGGEFTSGPLSRIAATAGRAGEDISRASTGLEETLAANRAAAGKARLEAHAAKTSAPLYEQDAKVIQKVLDEGLPSPTKSRMMDVARQERDLAMPDYEQKAAYLNHAVKPDWVWQGGRWRLAGEWVDVPKRYLNLSEKPKMPPTQAGQLTSRVEGRADEYADEAGFQDLDSMREWMMTHPRAPQIADYINGARDTVVNELERERGVRLQEAIDATGSPVKTAEGAIKYVRKVAASMRKTAQKAQAEYVGRTFAEREIGPRARGAVASGERTAQRMGEIKAQTNAVADKLNQALATPIATAEQQAARRKAIREVAAEFKRLYTDAFQGVRDQVKQDVEREVNKHLAPPGYVLESTEMLGSPSGKDVAIDETFDKFRRSYQQLSSAESGKVRVIWQGLELMNRLVRAGIVAIPIRHTTNLTVNALAAGADAHDIPEILAGRYEDNLAKTEAGRALIAEADAGGASSARETAHSFSMDKGYHSTFDIPTRARLTAERFAKAPATPAEPSRTEQVDVGTGEPATATIAGKPGQPAKLGPLGKVAYGARTVQLYSERGYNAMSHWLFGKVQRGYELSIYKALRSAGKTADEASLAVRDAMLRADAGGSASAVMNKLFYFYPWMRTAVPFWIKHGVIDPKWWTAPVAATRTTNELQGYDDPSKPFAVTLGQSSPGVFRRATLPIPQTLLGPAAAGIRAPIEAGAGVASTLAGRGGLLSGLQNAGEDIREPVQYLAGHANPLVSAANDLLSLASAGGKVTRTAPYNLFHVDPNRTEGENVRAFGDQALQRLFGPYEHLENVRNDPAWSLASWVAGGFIYDVKNARVQASDKARRKRLFSKVNGLINKAQTQGNTEMVNQLQASKDKIIERSEAILNAAGKPTPLPIVKGFVPEGGASAGGFVPEGASP